MVCPSGNPIHWIRARPERGQGRVWTDDSSAGRNGQGADMVLLGRGVLVGIRGLALVHFFQ